MDLDRILRDYGESWRKQGGTPVTGVRQCIKERPRRPTRHAIVAATIVVVVLIAAPVALLFTNGPAKHSQERVAVAGRSATKIGATPPNPSTVSLGTTVPPQTSGIARTPSTPVPSVPTTTHRIPAATPTTAGTTAPAPRPSTNLIPAAPAPVGSTTEEPSTTTIAPTSYMFNCANEQLTPDPAYVGLAMPQADELAAQRNEIIRVVEQDGIGLPTTSDRVSNRVDVAVSNGTITIACHE